MTIRCLAAFGLVAAAVFGPSPASAMILGQPALAGLIAPVAHGVSGHETIPPHAAVRGFRPCPPGFLLTQFGICVPAIARSL